MKNFGYILRLTLVLFLITAVVAGLLGAVNLLTKDKIAENTRKKAEDAMREVLQSESYESIELTESNKSAGITEAYICENGYIVRVSKNGFGGAIDMMVGIDLSGTVTGISVISHAETASLGANCTREDFRSQFVGANDTLAVSKDGGSIDALTGATVTSRAVAEGVNVALAFVKEVRG